MKDVQSEEYSSEEYRAVDENPSQRATIVIREGNNSDAVTDRQKCHSCSSDNLIFHAILYRVRVR